MKLREWEEAMLPRNSNIMIRLSEEIYLRKRQFYDYKPIIKNFVENYYNIMTSLELNYAVFLNLDENFVYAVGTGDIPIPPYIRFTGETIDENDHSRALTIDIKLYSKKVTMDLVGWERNPKLRENHRVNENTLEESVQKALKILKDRIIN